MNPYINYPFVPRALGRLRAHVGEAHAHKLRVKAYYTIRELSNHATELWALRSLGHEVLRSGSGGTGDPWLQEHLVTGYRSCWHNPIAGTMGEYDAALCNTGLSRWANYYVEGLVDLVRSGGLDGLYYDGIDFGIETIRRVRAVLQRELGGKGLLDLHSGNNNHPNHQGKYGSVSPALQYMGVLPHIDSLWFGEGFDYQAESEDYWLIEVSGLAWGTPSDLMCDRSYQGAAPWRGMLYGAMARMCTYREDDGFQHLLAKPNALWRLSDALGLDKANLLGYWDPEPPIKLQGCDGDVRVTSYVRKGKLALLALASWASINAPVAVRPTTLRKAHRKAWAVQAEPAGRRLAAQGKRRGKDTPSADKAGARPSRRSRWRQVPSEEIKLASLSLGQRSAVMPRTESRFPAFAWPRAKRSGNRSAWKRSNATGLDIAKRAKPKARSAASVAAKSPVPTKVVGLPPRRQNCSLDVNWATLGLFAKDAELLIPALSGWQLGRRVPLGERERSGGPVGPIPVHAQRGVLLVLADPSQSKLLSSLVVGECGERCQADEAVVESPPPAPFLTLTHSRVHNDRVVRPLSSAVHSHKMVGDLAKQPLPRDRGGATHAAMVGSKLGKSADVEQSPEMAALAETILSPKNNASPPEGYRLKEMRKHGSHTRRA